MSLLARNRVKKLLTLIQLLFLVGSLHATEYSIIDPENLITDEQKESITKSQENLLQDRDTLVSYAFYNVNTSRTRIKLIWESGLEEAAGEGSSSEKFHLLICVGIFSSQNTVDIFTKNQPVLEDVTDLTTCIASMKQSIGSQPDIQELIQNSPETIKDRLSYLNARPNYEEFEKTTARNTRTEKFMAYILNLVKIALFIIVTIIAILIFWYMLASLNNKRPHTFPVTKPKKRLHSPYAATSISQIKK